MRVQKTHWFRNTLLVLIVCAVAGTCLAAYQFTHDRNRTYASGSVQFSFDGAANGKTPNGIRFHVQDIYSDAVIGKAIQAAGLEGKYSPDQIRGALEVEGEYPDDIADQLLNYESLLDFNANRTLSVNEYHPTLYTVKLYQDFDPGISRSDLTSLLQNILTAFRDSFSETYAVSALSIEDEFNLDEFDYPHQLTILSQQMNQASLYAQELYQTVPTFLYGGSSFNDIAMRLESLIENDIARLNATITMSALTKNTNRLLTQYQYEIQNLNNQLEKQNECLNKLDQLIASYDKNEIIYLSTADSLNKIDGNSSETYDALVSERKGVADDITDIKSRIESYRLLLADMTGGGAETDSKGAKSAANDEQISEIEVAEMTYDEIEALSKAADEAIAEKTSALEANISILVEKQKSIMADFARMISAYNAQILNSSTVEIASGEYYAPSLLSARFLLRVIKTAGPVCSVGLIICLVLIIISRKKEQAAA